MPRKKAYNEEEVIEKAMQVFWKNGYDATSVRMLEKGMGINQFSIYSSFQNKQGVFLECIRHYKKKIKNEIIDDMVNSKDGIKGIKKYYYNFLKFTKDKGCHKGCFLTNTVSEFGSEIDKKFASEIKQLARLVHKSFAKILADTNKYDAKTIEKKANYLIVALQGLSVASKSFSKKQLHDFIEVTFENI